MESAGIKYKKILAFPDGVESMPVSSSRDSKVLTK